MRKSVLALSYFLCHSLDILPQSFAYSITSTKKKFCRRQIFSQAVCTAAFFAASPIPASAADLETFNDSVHGFSIRVPGAWKKTEQVLADRRTIILWSDPSDPVTSLFIAYTPVRDDFTSLGSFGNVDQVAAQTIMPKADLLNEGSDVSAKMLSAVSSKQAYFFDYTQKVGSLQPNTHFRTIFTLQQGATGGAGAVLVTITAQTPEERYITVKPTIDGIIESYGKSV